MATQDKLINLADLKAAYDTTLRVDAAQTLTEAQKTQARANIGALEEGALEEYFLGTGKFVTSSLNTASANYSSAEGYKTKATGQNSHAEGANTTVSGVGAHVEGLGGDVKGQGAHAEGMYTDASGRASHAEGVTTTASGEASHASGAHTVANHKSQTVFGEYNIADPSQESGSARGTYVEIVGNGINDSSKSNARTLDWSGNETLAGDLTVYKGSADEMNVGEVLTEIQDAVFPFDAKVALIDLLNRIAYTDDDAMEAVEELESILIGAVELISISATFNPGNNTFFSNAVLNDFKPYLTVIGTYSDGHSKNITKYNLSGTLTIGVNTITITYYDKTTTFTVTIIGVPSSYTELNWLTGTGTQYLDTGFNWNSNCSFEVKIKGLLTDQSYHNYYLGAAPDVFMTINSLSTVQGQVFTRFKDKTGYYGNEYFAPASTSTAYVLGMDKNKFMVNGTQCGTDYPSDYFAINLSFYLFARHVPEGVNGIAKCSIQYFKAWDENGNLIHHLVACLDANGTPCMYDKITNTVQYNLGTGTFSYEEVQQ